jgi:hypothetical protein
MTALVAAVLGLLACGLGLRIYMGREAEDRLAPNEVVNIAELRSPLPKPSFLACPDGYCSAAEAVASPVFDQPWNRLFEYWKEVVSGEKRLMNATADPDSRRFVYIQRSATFRFPDVITVEFLPLGPDRSSIAIFSRSRYGKYDFEKNRKRVEKWLVLLERMARSRAPAKARAQ